MSVLRPLIDVGGRLPGRFDVFGAMLVAPRPVFRFALSDAAVALTLALDAAFLAAIAALVLAFLVALCTFSFCRN